MERPQPVFDDQPCKEQGSVASQAHTTENVSNIRRSGPESVGEARILEQRGLWRKGPARGGAGGEGTRGRAGRTAGRGCQEESREAAGDSAPRAGLAPAAGSKVPVDVGTADGRSSAGEEQAVCGKDH